MNSIKGIGWEYHSIEQTPFVPSSEHNAKQALIKLHKAINARGLNEQERQFLFAGLYGGHAVTRRERGAWKQLEREINRRAKVEQRISFL